MAEEVWVIYEKVYSNDLYRIFGFSNTEHEAIEAAIQKAYEVSVYKESYLRKEMMETLERYKKVGYSPYDKHGILVILDISTPDQDPTDHCIIVQRINKC